MKEGIVRTISFYLFILLSITPNLCGCTKKSAALSPVVAVATETPNPTSSPTATPAPSATPSPTPTPRVAPYRFQKTFGGSNFEYGYAAQITQDLGFIVGGITFSWGPPSTNGHFYAVKYDSSGQYQWNKVYSYGNCETINDVFQTSDGGYVFVGWTNATGCGGGIAYSLIIKTDSHGTVSWAKTTTTTSDAYLVIQSQDGNILVGTMNAYLTKLNVTSGAVMWSKSYNVDWFYAMQEAANGDIVLAGHTQAGGAGADDILLIRTDNDGNPLWGKAYGDANGQDGYGHCLKIASDGGFIINGGDPTTTTGGFLIKTDSSGNVQWKKSYIPPGSLHSDLHEVALVSGGGYVAVGSTSISGVQKFWSIKTDSSGNLIWAMQYGGTSTSYGYAVREAPDLGYLMSGKTDLGPGVDTYLIKTDVNGLSGASAYESDITSSTSTVIPPFVTNNLTVTASAGPAMADVTIAVATGYSETTLGP